MGDLDLPFIQALWTNDWEAIKKLLAEEKNMTVHELKIDVEFFRAVECGDKTFEIRYNDRGYQKGDIVQLRPWKGSYYVEPYKGLTFIITYVIGYQQKDGWVVFGIKPVEIGNGGQ